jgi:Icc-related predicted phosphoesterase
MTTCFFVSDLHGQLAPYQKLFEAIPIEKPGAVFLGGDLLPSGLTWGVQVSTPGESFIRGFLLPRFMRMKEQMGESYPRIFLILGNDDVRQEEGDVIEGESAGVWDYIHGKKVQFGDYMVYGYAYVPPTPFRLKDWEKYDVSRYVDPGCIPPETGWRSVPLPDNETKYATIQQDLDNLLREDDLSKAIMLFHTPPYQTNLDRAALDGRVVDGVPLDLHVGSLAVRRLIETRQPLITMHGHIHESARITGSWKDRIGGTHLYCAAHDGPELALVRFDPERPEDACRELL